MQDENLLDSTCLCSLSVIFVQFITDVLNNYSEQI